MAEAEERDLRSRPDDFAINILLAWASKSKSSSVLIEELQVESEAK
jgi:hypothetical protein